VGSVEVVVVVVVLVGNTDEDKICVVERGRRGRVNDEVGAVDVDVDVISEGEDVVDNTS
jgi:hypothetical protein